MSLGVIAIGVTFAAIPAYRIFCEQTSFGGLTQVCGNSFVEKVLSSQIAKDFEKIANMKKVDDRLIRVQFNSDVPSSMRWEFKPQQHEVFSWLGFIYFPRFMSTLERRLLRSTLLEIPQIDQL